ncbi:glycerol-3-phosphate responsive antiterminator [Schaedlerella sp.]|uniref:glycerol-3-phosphate responsive antiterminator n=1 Tax=Schaedlerella sp. TaxID=2676057 RepID=UPI003749C3C5
MDGKEQIREIIEDTPVIMAVKDWEGVRRCTAQESKVVFILFGDVCSIDEIVKTVKDAGKIAIVHIDPKIPLNYTQVIR